MIWGARVAAVLLGAFVCGMATFLHRVGVEVGSIFIPWGLVLGALTGFLVARALTPWWSSGEFFVAGWALALSFGFGLGTQNQLIAFDWLGLTFLIAALGALFVALSQRFRL